MNRLITFEVRWFFLTSDIPQNIDQWLVNLFPELSQLRDETPRQDLYLPTPQSNVGLKISRGKIEMKYRYDQLKLKRTDTVNFNGVCGNGEMWAKYEWKYSNDLEMDTRLFNTMHTFNDRGDVVVVNKIRTIKGFYIDTQGLPTKQQKKDDLFCTVELARISKNADWWWTLGVNIIGDSYTLSIISNIMKSIFTHYPNIKDLTYENSYGYPYWIHI